MYVIENKGLDHYKKNRPQTWVVNMLDNGQESCTKSEATIGSYIKRNAMYHQHKFFLPSSFCSLLSNELFQEKYNAKMVNFNSKARLLEIFFFLGIVLLENYAIIKSTVRENRGNKRECWLKQNSNVNHVQVI